MVIDERIVVTANCEQKDIFKPSRERSQHIKLFEQIIKKYPNEREYAAKSQLYIGLYYEKLGLKQAKQAQEAFKKVIDNYPEQSEVVNEKLSFLLKVQTVIEKGDKEFKIRKVWADAMDVEGVPSPDGKYISFVNWLTGDLALKEVATGKVRNLTNKGGWNESDEFALFSRWSADAKYILFTKKRPRKGDKITDEEFKWDLWRVPAAGGEAQKLDLTMIQFWNLSTHPDGKRIAFSSYGTMRPRADVWVMENFLPEEKAQK